MNKEQLTISLKLFVVLGILYCILAVVYVKTSGIMDFYWMPPSPSQRNEQVKMYGLIGGGLYVMVVILLSMRKVK